MLDQDHTDDSLIGSTIDGGRYEVIDLLGEGGMGRVYRARQISMDREVALKILKATSGAEPTLLARFQQEARSVSRLRHPNTITVYDFGKTEGGQLFIAMELLGGQSMGDILAEEIRVPESRALHLMRQIGSAVAEAHEQGVVHRDLKPENIQVDQVGDEREFVKVLDFGIAKMVHGEESDGAGLSPDKKSLTLAGTVFGTPHYMSPEQVHGNGVDHRTDIYAMGCILYELLTGVPPFNGDTPMAVMMAQASTPPPDIRETHPDISVTDQVAQIILDCLHKDREQRLQSASAFVSRVEEIILELNDGSLSRRLRLNPADLELDHGKTTTNDVLDNALLAEVPDGSLFDDEGATELVSPQRHHTLTPDHTGEVAAMSGGLAADDAALKAVAAGQRPSPLRWVIALAVLALLGGGAWVLLKPGAQPVTTAAAGGEAPDQTPHVLKVDGSAVDYTLTSDPPGAEIREGGAALGVTPLTRTWQAGQVITLSFRLDGYVTTTRVLRVGLEQSTSVHVTLPKRPSAPAHLAYQIQSTPAGAEVRDGDEILGYTPFVWKVHIPEQPTQANLQILAEGHQPATLTVELPAEAPPEGAAPVALAPITLTAVESPKPDVRRRRSRRRGRSARPDEDEPTANTPSNGVGAPTKDPGQKDPAPKAPAPGPDEDNDPFKYEKVPLHVQPTPK